MAADQEERRGHKGRIVGEERDMMILIGGHEERCRKRQHDRRGREALRVLPIGGERGHAAQHRHPDEGGAWRHEGIQGAGRVRRYIEDRKTAAGDQAAIERIAPARQAQTNSQDGAACQRSSAHAQRLAHPVPIERVLHEECDTQHQNQHADDERPT